MSAVPSGLITVTRKDGGLADYTFTDGTKTITGKGYWDDATPWASGNQSLSYWDFHKKGIESFRIGTSADPNPLLPRADLLIHHGAGTFNSEGCLITARDNTGKDFIDNVYSYLQDQGIAPSDQTLFANHIVPSNLQVNVVDAPDNGAAYKIKVNIDKTAFLEGSSAKITVELQGAGKDGTLTKDLYVHLGFKNLATGQNDVSDIDFGPSTGFMAKPGLEKDLSYGPNDGQWVLIPKGSKSSQPVSVFFTSDGIKEGRENFEVSADYYMVRNQYPATSKKPDIFYRDFGQSVLQRSSEASVNYTVDDRDSVIGQTISQSGGKGHFSFPTVFAPDQTVTGEFTPYSIPDRMLIQDEDGTVYYDSTLTSGVGLPVNFTVGDKSNGNVTITVDAPQDGTAWEFSLASQGFQDALNQLAKPQSLQANVFRQMAAALTAPGALSPTQEHFSILTNTDTPLVEGDWQDTAGDGFSINRSGDLQTTETIGWRVKPDANSPVSGADFEGGVLPSGTLTFAAGEAETLPIYFGYADAAHTPIPGFYGLVQDGQSESPEAFSIELYDPATGNPVAANMPLSSLFQVFDQFGFVSQVAGTDQDETLNGTPDVDYLYGAGGNDTINGLDSDDFLFGGNGNDTINGDNGNDTLEGGFGNDVLNGGNGIDTAVYGRPRSVMDIQTLADGSVRVTDNSVVSLGTDTLKFMEFIQFSDQLLALAPVSPPPPSTSGTPGDDNLVGTDGNDTLIALAGNDIVNAKGGNDKIYGGEGNDVIDTGNGNDTVFAGSGNDTIRSGLGNAFLDGGEGNDKIIAGLGNNLLNGGNGNDVLIGSGGKDQLYGGDGADNLNAGSGNDLLYGGKNDDILRGGKGDDRYVFEKGDGHDLVEDSQGTDTIKFGASVTQNDVSLFRRADDLVVYYGSNSVFSVKDQFTTSPVEKLQLQDGHFLTQGDISNITNQIAAYSGPGGTPHSIMDVVANPNLQQLISWHA